ncbi:MAG: glycosyltransferase family 2 protein [Deinococcota bacterium]
MNAVINVLFWIVMLFLLVQGLTLLGNLLFFPVLKVSAWHLRHLDQIWPLSDAQALEDERQMTIPRVSILMPARNEAANLPDTLPRLLAQPRAYEILVLDDHSDDGTKRILEDFQARDERLRVLTGEPLPTSWTGKNWACQQLADAATGDILIFTDADVLWEPHTLDVLLSFQAERQAEYLSVWPRQQTPTWLERLTVPAIDMILLGWLPYLAVKVIPLAAFSAGNGQLMLWLRETYDAIGGHKSVQAEVLEDVRLGQRAKGLGANVELALGGRVISTRMYQDTESLLQGFSKNILAAHNNSRAFLIFSVLLTTLSYTLVWPLLLTSLWWFVPIGLGLSQRALTCLKARRNWLEFTLQPALVYPLWRIALRALKRTGYQWKGRSYS